MLNTFLQISFRKRLKRQTNIHKRIEFIQHRFKSDESAFQIRFKNVVSGVNFSEGAPPRSAFPEACLPECFISECAPFKFASQMQARRS